MLPGPHGGVINANAVCLGIELENLNDGKQTYTPEQYDETARQIVEWRHAFGYIPVVGHAALDHRKSDPRGWNWQRLESLVVRLTASMAARNNGS
jgi:N-acetyl-anhydromuramyl-L-alanine amidase AmpD